MTLKTSLKYRVPYADTDQMGVVYYANYLVYFERVRNEILREMEIPYTTWEESGLFLPVRESVCQYKKPAFYDDMLDLEGSFEVISSTRLKASCSVSRNGVTLAEGHTIHVCVRSSDMKPCRFPEFLESKLQTA